MWYCFDWHRILCSGLFQNLFQSLKVDVFETGEEMGLGKIVCKCSGFLWTLGLSEWEIRGRKEQHPGPTKEKSKEYADGYQHLSASRHLSIDDSADVWYQNVAISHTPGPICPTVEFL